MTPYRIISGRAIILTVVFVFSISTAALAGRMAVTAPVANVRSGPGTEYDVVWKMERYHPIDVLRTQGPWYLFRDFEGDTGWVHKSLLGNIKTVITVKTRCNVRKGPGTKYEILFNIGEAIPFKVLEDRGTWLHVEHADGDRGWIARSLVW